jgi:tetratricopeptide (TPR) repeat protein
MFGDDVFTTSKSGSKQQSDALEKTGTVDGEEVVILGYDDNGDTAVETKTRPRTGTTRAGRGALLYCMEDKCRFYRSATGSCQFDMIFSNLEDQKAAQQKNGSESVTKTALKGLAGEVSKSVSTKISKDIDKIWQFQTKSISELIGSLGDTEKNQMKTLDSFRRDFEKRLDKLAANVEKNTTVELKKKVDGIEKKLDSRAQSIDDFSATMSELVVNLHESITQLKNKSDEVSKQVVAVEKSVPREPAIRSVVEETVTAGVKTIKLPDVGGLLDSLEKNVRDLLREHKDAGRLDLAETKDIGLEVRDKLASWQKNLDEKMLELRSQQSGLELRLEKLLERYSDLATFLEKDREERERKRTTEGRSEAKEYNNKGVASFHNGAFETAKEQFIEATKIDPDFAEAYNNLGLAHTELGDDQKATEAFLKAVDLNPSLHAAYNNLGYIFFTQGKYDQAIEMYNEALGRSANNSSAYTNLGNAYYKLGKIEDATNAWEKALELDPSNEKARKNLQRVSEEK